MLDSSIPKLTARIRGLQKRITMLKNVSMEDNERQDHIDSMESLIKSLQAMIWVREQEAEGIDLQDMLPNKIKPV